MKYPLGKPLDIHSMSRELHTNRSARVHQEPTGAETRMGSALSDNLGSRGVRGRARILHR